MSEQPLQDPPSPGSQPAAEPDYYIFSKGQGFVEPDKGHGALNTALSLKENLERISPNGNGTVLIFSKDLRQVEEGGNNAELVPKPFLKEIDAGFKFDDLLEDSQKRKPNPRLPHAMETVSGEAAIAFTLDYIIEPETSAGFVAIQISVVIFRKSCVMGNDKERPVILIYPGGKYAQEKWEDILDGLEDHLSDDEDRRMKRLEEHPYFIFSDLDTCFCLWQSNIDRLKRRYKDAEKRSKASSFAVISRVRLLHHDIGMTQKLQQARNIYVAAVEAYSNIVNALPWKNKPSHWTGQVRPQQDTRAWTMTGRAKATATPLDQTGKEYSLQFVVESGEKLPKHGDRGPTIEASNENNTLDSVLRSILTKLKHHDDELNLLKEQLRNLIDLEFNIQSTRTNQNVEAITSLAFLFVPLSFVSSVFGVNGIEEPRWFWVTCLPILALSLCFALLTRPAILLTERLQSDLHDLALYPDAGAVERGLYHIAMPIYRALSKLSFGPPAITTNEEGNKEATNQNRGDQTQTDTNDKGVSENTTTDNLHMAEKNGNELDLEAQRHIESLAATDGPDQGK